MSPLESLNQALVKFNAIPKHKYFRPAVGAGLAVLCGLALWQMPLGDPWSNASYDYLFFFGARSVTNKIVLIKMDNAAYVPLGQQRGKPWDRSRHAELLRKLKADGCPLVFMDAFFINPRVPESDAALAEAIRQHGRVVLATKLTEPQYPDVDMAEVIPLQKAFVDVAAGTGVGRTDAKNHLSTARRHWPFPSSDEDGIQSLPWVGAKLAGAQLSRQEEERWLRYYGRKGNWDSVSYHFAISNAPGYFRNKIVFVGSDPAKKEDPEAKEEDKFQTPYTHTDLEAKSVGGVEILATTFLNLVNGDWLRRMSDWLEVLALIGTGVVFGSGLCWWRPLISVFVAGGAFLAVTLGAVLMSYYSNYWFPWLIIAGGQIPCALVWALATRHLRPPVMAGQKKTVVLSPDLFAPEPSHPEAPDYEFFGGPFGEGAFGKVWVVRNSIGQFQALKTVYQSKFGHETKPYEMEFKGIKRFKPLSGEHPGLLRVDFVSKTRKEGYFYYVMELGDGVEPKATWEMNPTTYRPRDLATASLESEHGRLPVPQCVEIVASLAEALGFLHREGFVHRDIKPTNIIFVRGRPKLADVGLVTDIRPVDQVTSVAGTEHYMPPPPEMPGTPAADIYALGKVLYVISTGHHPRQFPELPPGLLDGTEQGEHFMKLNAVIRKACEPDRTRRYQTAEDLHEALRALGPAGLPPN